MKDLELRLTNLLGRKADEVDVRPVEGFAKTPYTIASASKDHNSVTGTRDLATMDPAPTLRTRSSDVTIIDVEPTSTRPDSRHRWPMIAAAATVVAVVAGGLALATRDDDPSDRADQPTTDAPDPQAAEAEGTARGFLAAYNAHDAGRALAYLTDEAITQRWNSPEHFRLSLALDEAQRYQETVTDCQPQSETAVGVTVRCRFDFHAIGSDELGLGPFTDNYWELTIRDGEITNARTEVALLTNGFSQEMWEPFAAWVATTYPDDVLTMYTTQSQPLRRVTEESISLWRRYTERYVNHVRSTRGVGRWETLEAGVGLIGLPPEDATPSTPEHGELVDDFALSSQGYHYAGAARLYADGRLIWRMYLPTNEWSSSTGWVELRLTPDTAELVRDNVVIDNAPGGEHREMAASRLFALLPPSTWDDQRPYVPSGYGVCLELRRDAGGRIDAPTEQLLAVLPAPAAALLDGRPATTPPHPTTPGLNGCLAVPTEDARQLDRALSDVGLEQDAQANQYQLQYQLAYPLEDGGLLDIVFEPVFPDGSISCSACG